MGMQVLGPLRRRPSLASYGRPCGSHSCSMCSNAFFCCRSRCFSRPRLPPTKSGCVRAGVEPVLCANMGDACAPSSWFHTLGLPELLHVRTRRQVKQSRDLPYQHLSEIIMFDQHIYDSTTSTDAFHFRGNLSGPGRVLQNVDVYFRSYATSSFSKQVEEM